MKCHIHHIWVINQFNDHASVVIYCVLKTENIKAYQMLIIQSISEPAYSPPINYNVMIDFLVLALPIFKSLLIILLSELGAFFMYVCI